MFNPFNTIQRLIIDSSSTVSTYLGVTETEKLNNEISVKIKNQKHQVMLYGAYNAGKSTLINVLLGINKAPVNDIPTTFQVDEYDWNGIRLLDTPGVNAPIEHEEATEEQVKRSNLLLFVIREGDQDFNDLYQRLFKMLRLNKKIFIVLNHQAPNVKDKVLALQKINSILLKMAIEHGVTDHQVAEIAVFPINLQTALNARKKNSEKLLEYSGYSLFVGAFEHWLAQYDNANEYLASLQKMINEIWFSSAIDKINAKLKGNNCSVLDSLQSNRSIIENEKKLITNSAYNFIRQEVNLLRGDISETLSQCNNQSMLDTELQRLFNPLIEKVDTWLVNQTDSVTSKLSLALNEMYTIMENKETFATPLSDLALEGTRNALSSKENIKEAFQIGRALKIPGLKGRWSKTFDKWAGKAGPAIQIVFAAYDIWSANKEQEENNKKLRQKSMALHQAVEQISSTVITDLCGLASDNIAITFDDRIITIEKEIQIYMSNQSSLEKDKETLLKTNDLMLSVAFPL